MVAQDLPIEMSAAPPTDGNTCPDTCSSASSLEELNRECFCVGVDLQTLRAEVQAVLHAHGQPASLVDSHPHLFASLPVYVARPHIEQMTNVVSAIEDVVASPLYQSAVLSWAPEIAQFDPGSPGGLLGLDFHLSPDGPKLIEINTNPGGALLNTLLGQAQRTCAPDRMAPPVDPEMAEERVLASILTEWQFQRAASALTFVAIVDEAPAQQYLYPEFVLYRELFRRHGYRAEICAPDELLPKQGRLWSGADAVDLIYNRLTDFSLQSPLNNELRSAYLAGRVALSPHPRAHALYADKRNLGLLGTREFLRSADISQSAIDILATSVPTTTLLTPGNRDVMWANRRNLFFKPAAGYGSKASYRGDKLTHRVWNAILEGTYVAQDIVAASERRIASATDPLKVDVRCYAYRGQALLYAARMYRGQTTNFRTPGGGFAPVLTDV